MYPREGGGHEHIHCQLTILDEPSLGDGVIFAKYYFDGDPSAVFRSRLYQVSPSSRSADADLRMRIFRLCDVLERELRRTNYDPHAVDWQLGDPFTYLCGCDVFWKSSPEASKSMDLFAFEGFMKNEGCRVFSPQMKQYIAIKDDLTLGYTHLAVNDRGFDQEVRRHTAEKRPLRRLLPSRLFESCKPLTRSLSIVSSLTLTGPLCLRKSEGRSVQHETH